MTDKSKRIDAANATHGIWKDLPRQLKWRVGQDYVDYVIIVDENEKPIAKVYSRDDAEAIVLSHNEEIF
jgi:hypothetical protein